MYWIVRMRGRQRSLGLEVCLQSMGFPIVVISAPSIESFAFQSRNDSPVDNPLSVFHSSTLMGVHCWVRVMRPSAV